MQEPGLDQYEDEHTRGTVSVSVGSLQMPVTVASEPADGVLLQGVRHGDEHAFEELFARYYTRVYGIALRLLGDPQDAEELAQDVFLKLYRQPITADDANLGGWLYRVVTNDSFNALRSRRRRRGWLQRFAQRTPLAGIDHEDPQAIVIERDDANQVRAALAQLPERQHAALVLRASGMSYADLAGALDIKPSSVGTILARAEHALRAVWEQSQSTNDNGKRGKA
jgi:RNA polymerase sigma-70 factor (ECF subfamily)